MGKIGSEMRHQDKGSVGDLVSDFILSHTWIFGINYLNLTLKLVLYCQISESGIVQL